MGESCRARRAVFRAAPAARPVPWPCAPRPRRSTARPGARGRDRARAGRPVRGDGRAGRPADRHRVGAVRPGALHAAPGGERGRAHAGAARRAGGPGHGSATGAQRRARPLALGGRRAAPGARAREVGGTRAGRRRGGARGQCQRAHGHRAGPLPAGALDAHRARGGAGDRAGPHRPARRSCTPRYARARRGRAVARLAGT